MGVSTFFKFVWPLRAQRSVLRQLIDKYRSHNNFKTEGEWVMAASLALKSKGLQAWPVTLKNRLHNAGYMLQRWCGDAP